MGGHLVAFRNSVVWGAIAFGVALAVVIGIRLEQAALTMLVGVACGVAASIPTGVLIVYLLRRRDGVHQSRVTMEHRRGMPQAPPVIVIAPPTSPQLPQLTAWPSDYAAPQQSRRDFAVIGEEGIQDGDFYWQE